MAPPLAVSPSTANRAASKKPNDSKPGRDALLERILSNPHLPSPPTLALQIVEKTRQANCEPTDISNLLGQDPAICGKVLKTLNSSLYSFSEPVKSLQRAVAILGLKPLRSLVLGLTLPAMQLRLEADDGLRRYWKDSVAGAIFARELAQNLRYPSPEDVLVASLLRDLGMLLLRQNFPTLYEPIWNGTVPITDGQCEWEKRNLGIDHAAVSAALLDNWGLPAELVDPVRFHHCPQDASALPPILAKRAYLLEFASRLTQLEQSAHNPAYFRETLKIAKDRFGLERPELESFLNQVRGKIEAFADLLRIDIGTCPNFTEVLAAGCQELIQLSTEAASGRSLERPPGSSSRNGKKTASGRDHQAVNLTDTLNGNVTISNLTPEFIERLRDLGSKARIKQYEVDRIIGRGAMGIVLKAFDPSLARSVAIKVMAPELADSSVAHQRFALEARFAAAIRHENVVSVFAVNELESVPFLVMEYIEGTSLEDQLEKGHNFSPKEIGRIALEMAQGLHAAHKLRVVHRDIKPANILIESDNQRVRITDFGLARAMDSEMQLSQAGMLIGTPVFMSPEQVDGKPLTGASDLFSLGSVLYVLCTGQFPFPCDSMSALLNGIATKAPVPVRELNPTIPLWLSTLIEKLHAKAPGDRFPSALALADYCKRSPIS
jgi:HD-like signal output (HDOD) protein/tRNA A-37 threonylcarbamoyl transferase component Bud32